MKLAISNIAWQKNEDDQVYCLMEKYGFTGLEIAPGRIWENPLKQSQETIKRFKKGIDQQGLSIIGLQGLLFGHPEFKIFRNKEGRESTLAYLKKVIDLGSRLEAEALIFGSPKNRSVDGLNKNQVMKIALDFFSQLGQYAVNNNIFFCIEPNPTAYGTNFINSTEEALSLVKNVNHPGFKLHLDLGSMILNNENIPRIVRKAAKYSVYAHLSFPYLLPINKKYFREMTEFIRSLKENKYQGWLSIEMKNISATSNLKNIEESFRLVNQTFCHTN